MPTPRPYEATMPDKLRSVCTRTVDPDGDFSIRNVAAACAPPRPLGSVPWARTRAVWPTASSSSNVTVPAKLSETGPSRTAMSPLYVLLSTTSVSRAPGMHGAIRSMSMSRAQAWSGGSGTSNELSNSMHQLRPYVVIPDGSPWRVDPGPKYHGIQGKGAAGIPGSRLSRLKALGRDDNRKV